MPTSPRALGATLLCLAGFAAHAPAFADQWRIDHATVIQLDGGPGVPATSPLHVGLSFLAAPFKDGWIGAWDSHPALIQGVTLEPGYSSQTHWQLSIKQGKTFVDLANMRASFQGLELDRLEVVSGFRGGDSYWYRTEALLGSSDFVKLKALGDGRYQASWQVRANPYEVSQESGDPLYAVNLTFAAFPEGTPWSYAPVPEPDSVFMALAGIGAVGWARRRQLQRLVA